MFRWLRSKEVKQDEPPTRQRRRGLVVEEYSEEPRCAYVIRLEPTKWQGVLLRERVGRFDNILDLHDDLVPRVHARCGGGLFVARVFDERDKKKYFGSYRFRVAGAPNMSLEG